MKTLSAVVWQGFLIRIAKGRSHAEFREYDEF